jgi:serine/threonine-protein kinase
LRKINPNIPPELERIVSKALAKDRNLRYQTAAAFHRELSRFLNRQYPDFSPQDFSVFIKTLFAAEILDSRKKMVEYAKIEIRQEAPQLTGTSAKIMADQTLTQATSTENSVGLLDFENIGIEQSRTASRRNAVMPQQQTPHSPTAGTINDENTSTPTPMPSVTPQPPSSHVASPPPPPGAGVRVNRTVGGDLPSTQGIRLDHSYRESSYNRVPQGTMYTTSRSLSGSNVRSGGWPSLALPLVLIAFAFTMGGAALVYSDPASTNPWTRHLRDIFLPADGRNTGDPNNGVIDLPSVEYVSIGVSTTPPGAEVFINDRQQQDLTPMRISLPKNKEVRISFRIKGFATHEQVLVPTRHENLIVALKGDRKGYLDIQVLGAGIVTVDGKPVAQNAPANRIPIPADRDVLIRAFDPTTKASDEMKVRVAENATKKIVLIPRASVRRPDAPQKQ